MKRPLLRSTAPVENVAGVDWQCQFHHRRAFTLMETLAALAILGLVVSSLSASLHLYWKYRSVSRSQITIAQLQRGIVDDLTSDLRMTLQDPVALQAAAMVTAARSASATESAGSERFLNVTEQVLELPTDLRNQPVHFVGTSQSLALLHDQSNPRFDQARSGYQSAGFSHIVWWVNTEDSVRLPLFHSGPQLIPVTVNASKDRRGLVRKARRDSGGAAVSADEDELLVSADVTSLQLRYFDGENWRTQWNSFQQQALPLAIEVVITIEGGPEQGTPVVIWLPQASD
ncbi:MAG: type II secretion system protein GspJ [Planctomycetaceae bacterium]